MAAEGMCDTPLTVLILSPLRKGNGNFTTVDRIRRNLAIAGHRCDLCDPATLTSQTDFRRKLQEGRVDLLVGIHAFKTGPVMRESGLPYLLILGGTDIHVFCDDPDKMAAMTLAVYHARFVICFSETNKERALSLWPDLPSQRVNVISQAVETCPSVFRLVEHLRDVTPHVTCLSHPELRPFIMVGGVRPVKNPLYLVQTFQEWHKVDQRIILVIIGHKLDQDYCRDVLEPAISKAPGVIHLPGLPIADVHAAMSQAVALVNSSDSEGMCLSILEAMSCGTAVLARDIPANRAIVTHDVTGLLYNSPQTFMTSAMTLMTCDDVRQRLTSAARGYVRHHHNMAAERLAYLSLLSQCHGEAKVAMEPTTHLGSISLATPLSQTTPLSVTEPPPSLTVGKSCAACCQDLHTRETTKTQQTLSCGTSGSSLVVGISQRRTPDNIERDRNPDNSDQGNIERDVCSVTPEQEGCHDDTEADGSIRGLKHDVNQNQIQCVDRTCT